MKLQGVFRYALDTYTYNPSNSVTNSLINSGNYELIQNDTLRNYLVTWQDVYQDFLEEINHQKYRYEVMDVKTADNIDFSMAELGDPKAIEITLNYLTSREFRGMLDNLRGRLRNVVNDINQGIVENHLNEIIRLTKSNEQTHLP